MVNVSENISKVAFSIAFETQVGSTLPSQDLKSFKRNWDPDGRFLLTSTQISDLANGRFPKPTGSILNAVGLEIEGKKSVVCLCSNERQLYYMLSIGVDRYLTICNEEELSAINNIFTGKEVNGIVKGNNNNYKNKVIKEVGLSKSLVEEKMPRIARLTAGNSDLHLLLGEKGVLNSHGISRGITFSRDELPAIRSLFATSSA